MLKALFIVVGTLTINQSDENLKVVFVSKCSKCHAKLEVFYDSLSIHLIFQCGGDILFVLYLKNVDQIDEAFLKCVKKTGDLFIVQFYRIHCLWLETEAC